MGSLGEPWGRLVGTFQSAQPLRPGPVPPAPSEPGKGRPRADRWDLSRGCVRAPGPSRGARGEERAQLAGPGLPFLPRCGEPGSAWLRVLCPEAPGRAERSGMRSHQRCRTPRFHRGAGEGRACPPTRALPALAIGDPGWRGHSQVRRRPAPPPGPCTCEPCPVEPGPRARLAACLLQPRHLPPALRPCPGYGGKTASSFAFPDSFFLLFSYSYP